MDCGCRPPSCKPYGQTPNHLDPTLYTHIIFAFAKVDGSNYTVVGVEDDDDMLIQQMTALKSGNSGLKCMISIGGWSFSRADEAFKGGLPACAGGQLRCCCSSAPAAV